MTNIISFPTFPYLYNVDNFIHLWAFRSFIHKVLRGGSLYRYQPNETSRQVPRLRGHEFGSLHLYVAVSSSYLFV